VFRSPIVDKQRVIHLCILLLKKIRRGILTWHEYLFDKHDDDFQTSCRWSIDASPSTMYSCCLFCHHALRRRRRLSVCVPLLSMIRQLNCRSNRQTTALTRDERMLDWPRTYSLSMERPCPMAVCSSCHWAMVIYYSCLPFVLKIGIRKLLCQAACWRR
jgi:hypothetical protein